MTRLTEDGLAVRQAVMYMDIQRAELRIVGAHEGKASLEAGCAFHTLRGAQATPPPPPLLLFSSSHCSPSTQ